MPKRSSPPMLGVLLDDDDVVPGARELLRAGEPGGAGADDGDPLAGAVRRDLRLDPALRPALVDDRALDGLDGHRLVGDVERAARLAGRRADAAGELREVVGRVQRLRAPRASARDRRGRSSRG